MHGSYVTVLCLCERKWWALTFASRITNQLLRNEKTCNFFVHCCCNDCKSISFDIVMLRIFVNAFNVSTDRILCFIFLCVFIYFFVTFFSCCYLMRYHNDEKKKCRCTKLKMKFSRMMRNARQNTRQFICYKKRRHVKYRSVSFSSLCYHFIISMWKYYLTTG